MVKQINVAFDDEEHKKLELKKGELSWHDFILKLLDKEVKK
jgi:hypothetical protein